MATVAGAALLPLAGCQPAASSSLASATVSPAADSATAQPADPSTEGSNLPAPTQTAPVATATALPTATPGTPRPRIPAARGTGGPGSETITITSPVAVSGHVDTTVTCGVTGNHYTASASAVVQGYTVAETVVAANYHAPGTYTILVTVSLTIPGEGRYVITAVPASAQITDTGGSVSFSATSDSGRTLAGSIAWACSV
ncbi:hypothetical protein FraEuI1c_0468 [Pseudofrankia inefficax]|uniref:Ig-like domain-containing protein n=1 Tax=Pseudofrankia inefficax (strain DSM 45817 / CECT 9037 / DDB 130130 / EuI1c) TaxID=298654 RepID=E3J9Y9_PSEI1|nr:hypothetical protein FraEuI1c_0468 [Pseudofrankia inefficax]